MISVWKKWTAEEERRYIKKVEDKIKKKEMLLPSEKNAISIYRKTGKVSQRDIELWQMYED